MTEKTCICSIMVMIYGPKAPSIKDGHGLGCPCFVPAWMRRLELPAENKPIYAAKELVR